MMKKKNILAVDDMPTMLSMIRFMLRGEYQIFPANSVKDARALLERTDLQMDLVLLDLDMPVASGFELLQEIKSNPDLQHLPVIMLTGNTEQESVIRAVQAGAIGYIVKPFTEENLKQKIRAALKFK